MSSTRTAPEGAPLRQDRYASDPAYVEIRGVSGTAVAAKASLYVSVLKRNLLLFLQSLSISQQGFDKVAMELLEMFPDRIGTPAMHKHGVKAGRLYSVSAAKEIDDELGLTLDHMHRHFSDPDLLPCELERSADRLVEICRQRLAGLDDFLVRLCIDPKLEITLPGEEKWQVRTDRRAFQRMDGTLGEDTFEPAELLCFADVCGALFEYQRRYAERASQSFAKTTISALVLRDLNHALKHRKCMLIRGNSGIGKSHSIRAFSEMHRGETLLVSLKGITTKTSFFRQFAKAAGVGCSTGLSVTQVQARVEDYLERVKPLVLVDEGQYLFGQQERIYSHPALVNWLNTSCYNSGIPYVIIATLEFDRRRRAVEKQTTWSSEQLARRLNRATELPAAPTSHDLLLIGQQRAPHASEALLEKIAGYAMTAKRFATGVIDVIEDAELIAQENGRPTFIRADVNQAIERRGLSDMSLKRAFADKPAAEKRGKKSGQRGAGNQFADSMQGGCTDDAEAEFAGRNRPALEAASHENLPGDPSTDGIARSGIRPKHLMAV